MWMPGTIREAEWVFAKPTRRDVFEAVPGKGWLYSRDRCQREDPGSWENRGLRPARADGGGSISANTHTLRPLIESLKDYRDRQ